MTIRIAAEKDIPRVLALLSQVLEIHAAIRPDIFIPGTTKYTREDLLALFADAQTPVYVAVDDDDRVMGYAFCALREPPAKDNVVPFRTLYVDDLCVDEACRGQGIGRALFDFVLQEARRRGCYEVTLCVWEGNDSARRFYDCMGMKPKETVMEYVL